MTSRLSAFTRASALALRLLGGLSALALAAAPAASAHAEEPAAPATLLVFESAPWDLDPEAVREAVAREIGGAVALAGQATPGRAALVLRSEPERRVTLTYHADDGRRTERTIDLPDEPDRAAETIALLAANLVRDEAAELAAALGKRPAKEPPEPEAAPAQAPEPAPPSPVKPSPVKPGPAKHASPVKPGPAKRLAAEPPVPEDYPCWRPGLARVVGGADVLPFVGTSTSTGTDLIRTYSANLFAGYTGGLAGAEISAGVNIEHTFMCGGQLATLANVVAGPVRGVQIASVLNFGTSVYGAQFGDINIAAGPLHGAQLGGINAARHLAGAQIGALAIAGDATGLQVSAFNLAAGDVTGVQIGALNIATGQVRGAQIGVVNYADRSTFSFGLINIVPHGRLHLDLWAQESAMVMAGVKHGGDYFHNIYGVGAQVAEDRVRPALTLGLGARIPIVPRLYVDVDVLGYTLHEPSSFALASVLAQARAALGVRLLPRLALYAGPTYNFAYAFGRDPDLSPYGSLLINDDPLEPIRGWPGMFVGVQVL